MAGEVTRTVRIVYEVDGVEEAITDQQSLERALGETGAALADQGEAFETAGAQMADMADVATRSEQTMQRMHQQATALASGLNGLAAILGTESEAGALVGRMGQFAAVGIQVGSVFGPAGAVVGGIVGAALPALGELAESLRDAADDSDDLTVSINSQATAYDDLLESIRSVNRERNAAQTLSMGLGSLEEQTAAVQAQERTLENIQATMDAIMSAEATHASTAQLEALGRNRRLVEGRLADAREALELAREDERLEGEAFLAGDDNDRGGGGSRRGGRGGGRQRDTFRSDGGAALRALAAQGESDAARAERMGRPSEFDVMGADLQRQQRNRGFGGGRGGDPVQAQIASLEQLKDKQQQIHDEQMQRIEQQVEAWTGAGQKIGSTLYNAFQTAATGQESLDVAVVKGFKGLAIQFGGQMVNEGIAALLTAAGNTVANPPMAATKAAEGAGKLALGIGLGAAGAAIPVPSSGAQARTPRLGPAEDSSRGGGSTIVNMNAPSVVTGSGSQVGRLIGRSLDDARQRFGRAA